MNRNIPLPPKGLREITGIPTDDVIFFHKGLEFFDLLKDKAGLKSTDSVLDIGCGVGHLTYFLADWLAGHYDGFDILPSLTEWCEKAFNSYPLFHFKCVDAKNNEYNPTGEVDPSKLIFPYQDASMDFVVAQRTLSYLLPDAFDNYINQIARVMKPGSRAVITLYLRNGEVTQLIRSGKSSMPFYYHRGQYSMVNELNPEENLCYAEEWVLSRIKEAGLSILQKMYGSWCGRESKNLYEDCIIVEKI